MSPGFFEAAEKPLKAVKTVGFIPLRRRLLFLSLLLLLGLGKGLAPFIPADKTIDRGQVVSSAFLDQFSYSGKFLDISAETIDARATFWKSDGSMVFIVGRETNNVVAYSVNDPWQVHTATFLMEEKVPGEFQNGLYIRHDGRMMWVFDRTSIWAFNLEYPWDISSRSEGINHQLGHFVLRGHDIDFTPDGYRLYIDDRDAGAVFEYTLSNPWDIATGMLTNTLDISHEQKEVRGIEFIFNGMAMILLDTGRNELLHYQLEAPYHIPSARLVNTFNIRRQSRQGRGLSFNAELTSFYVTGRNEGKIFQYDLKVE
jgi:hypothetical protein